MPRLFRYNKGNCEMQSRKGLQKFQKKRGMKQ